MRDDTTPNPAGPDQPVPDRGPGTGRYVPGTPVYDSAGKRMGTVREYDEAASRLVLRRDGLFGTQHIYVPIDVIGREDGTGIYLNLTEEDVSAPHWGAPPVAHDVSNIAADRIDTHDATY